MDKPRAVINLLNKLRSKKGKDYTYITVFFLIFSIFIIFAIRPSLTTAISLRQQYNDLQRLNDQYEQVVSNIVVNQATLENARDQLYLINDAMPDSPTINKLISDIEKAGSDNSINFSDITIGEVNLVQTAGQRTQQIVINVNATTTFDNLMNFIKDLSKQRRLKYVKQLSIAREVEESSQSSQLKVLMEIDGYYL